MPSRVIYRLPPYVLGPQVLLPKDAQDRKPWSLVVSGVPDQWANTKGAGVCVAILDTGLWKHKDLPDPVFVANFTRSQTDFDHQGHSTHVAGTIGARLDGAGVVGWAPECSLGCVKVLGDDGAGTDEGIAKGIYYAAEHGAQIINMSLGGGYSPRIAQACQDVVQQGVFVICAAGNEGGDPEQSTVGYPAKLPETIAIASYNQDKRISEYSSQGPEVDVAFPGEDILSTWLDGTFRSISGTSMATPACSGLTALLLGLPNTPGSDRPKHNTQLRERLKAHAVDMGAPGFDAAFGWGVPDTAHFLCPTSVAAPLQPLSKSQLVLQPAQLGSQQGFFIAMV